MRLWYLPHPFSQVFTVAVKGGEAANVEMPKVHAGFPGDDPFGKGFSSALPCRTEEPARTR